MATKLVSIIMPAYNAETYIGQAIESVLGQSYTNWELVIIDDGSIDQTNAVASKYIDARIRIVRQENGGEAVARNTALRNIRGEFLAFLDADDVYLPDHLESTVGYLSIYNQVDGVYTDGYYIDQLGNRLQTLSSRRRGPFEGNLFEEVVHGSDVFGPPVCVVLRTSLINKYGLKFDEDIIIGPDWDFFVKYADLASFGYIDQATCLYRLHTTNISIRVGLEKRSQELAKCRINAIKMNNFRKCFVGVQTEVFYDLLCNLLIGFPKRQLEITQWAEFMLLPKKEQARLFRLMASKTVIYGEDHSYVKHWLQAALQIYPADWYAGFLLLLFRVHPSVFRLFVRLRNVHDIDPRMVAPFSDMKLITKS